MGNTVSYIIPNDFHEMDNQEARINYVNRTMQFVRDYFCADWVVYQSEDDIYPSDDFGIRPLPVWIELHDGFWLVKPMISYWYYFMQDKNGRVGLREDNFDLCRMFGVEEGYAFDEYVLYDVEEIGFKAWLKQEKKRRGAGWRIPEYNYDFWKKEENLDWKNFENCYHDSFIECKEVLSRYRREFPGYDILTTRLWGNFIFGRKDGALYLLDTKSRQPFNKSKLEFVDYHLEGVEIHTGGSKFFFDYAGNPITPPHPSQSRS